MTLRKNKRRIEWDVLTEVSFLSAAKQKGFTWLNNKILVPAIETICGKTRDRHMPDHGMQH